MTDRESHTTKPTSRDKLLREIKRLAKSKPVKAPSDPEEFLKWLNN